MTSIASARSWCWFQCPCCLDGLELFRKQSIEHRVYQLSYQQPGRSVAMQVQFEGLMPSEDDHSFEALWTRCGRMECGTTIFRRYPEYLPARGHRSHELSLVA